MEGARSHPLLRLARHHTQHPPIRHSVLPRDHIQPVAAVRSLRRENGARSRQNENQGRSRHQQEEREDGSEAGRGRCKG
eukprot:2717853-Rhodomonas_salina.1